MKCPLCGAVLPHAVSGTCPGCGLWWVSGRREEVFPPDAVSDATSSSTLHLVLREDPVGVGDFIVLAFSCLGFGTVFAVIWTFCLNPSDLGEWGRLLLGLSVGGTVGTYTAFMIVARLLHIASPSQLDGDPTRLHLRVWKTWEGLRESFRRTDVKVPRSQITGVGFAIGQGGQTQLFVLHASGLAFGTGWDGTRADAMRLKDPLLHWMAWR